MGKNDPKQKRRSVFDDFRKGPSQFRSAGDRRLGDAERLYEGGGGNQRINGAVYLAGIAIECFLKALLLEKRGWSNPDIVDAGKLRDVELREWGLLHEHRLKDILEALPRFRERVELADRSAQPQRWQNMIDLCEAWTIYVRYTPLFAPREMATRYVEAAREVKSCLD